MSIERQSRDSQSALRSFLDRHLPERGNVVQVWRSQMRSCETVPVDGDRSHLGQALELRIGLDLVTKLPYLDVLGFLPAVQCSELLRACGLVSVSTAEPSASATSDPMLQVWTRDSYPSELDDSAVAALNAVLLAAEFESVAHRKVTSNVQQQRILFAAMQDMRDSSGGDSVTESVLLKPLIHLWREYVAHGRNQLRELGDRVLVSPAIVPGFATADLVVGLTLVEIKNYIDPGPHIDAWLDQLLGYLLIDRWNTLKISRLALYCGWQGTTLAVSVNELLQASSPGAVPALPVLRRQFREALGDDLDEAEQRYQQKRFPHPQEAITLLQ